MSRGRNPKFAWLDGLTASGIRPSSCITVGVAIANRWNGGNDHPYASVPHLVKTTSLSRATVERALRRLREEGWIAQVRRGGRHGDQVIASTWRMTFPNPSLLRPNPSLVTSQPVSSDGLLDQYLDQRLRPTRTLSGGLTRCTVGSDHAPGDPDCPWCVPIDDDPWTTNPT